MKTKQLQHNSDTRQQNWRQDEIIVTQYIGSDSKFWMDSLS